jgi:hypothetical protein
MWSFYVLAIMFAFEIIDSIVRFGAVRTLSVTGTQKAISLGLLIGVLYIFWDFFEPLKYDIGLIMFTVIAARSFASFVLHLNKKTFNRKFGYYNFFNSLSYLVLIILYQIFIK